MVVEIPPGMYVTADDALFPSDFSVAVAVSFVAEGSFP